MSAECSSAATNAPDAAPIRLWPEVRSALVELDPHLGPGICVYLGNRYDFQQSDRENPRFVRVTLLHLIRRLYADPPRTFEVPEPMYLRFWAHGLVAAIAYRAGCRHLGVTGSTCAWAIDNSPVYQPPRRAEWIPRRLWFAALSAAVRLYLRFVDRITFGTPDARENYALLAPSARAVRNANEILDLPQPCDCPPVGRSAEPRLLFVGAAEERKGFFEVVAAFTSLVHRNVVAKAVIVAPGLDERATRALSSTADGLEVLLDPPRELIHREFRMANVVVLPSRRDGRWREQVGQPILEALAHGCLVVTSDETGIRDWLSRAGHVCLPNPDLGSLEAALEGVVRSGAWMSCGTGELPEIAGRCVADRAFHGVVPEGERRA